MPFVGRNLVGDFAEIIEKVELNENIAELAEEELYLHLSEHGQLARDILLNDLKLLKAHGAAPILNLIRCYDRDDANPIFPTDVYSFHVDRLLCHPTLFYARTTVKRVK